MGTGTVLDVHVREAHPARRVAPLVEEDLLDLLLAGHLEDRRTLLGFHPLPDSVAPACGDAELERVAVGEASRVDVDAVAYAHPPARAALHVGGDTERVGPQAHPGSPAGMHVFLRHRVPAVVPARGRRGRPVRCRRWEAAPAGRPEKLAARKRERPGRRAQTRSAPPACAGHGEVPITTVRAAGQPASGGSPARPPPIGCTPATRSGRSRAPCSGPRRLGRRRSRPRSAGSGISTGNGSGPPIQACCP